MFLVFTEKSVLVNIKWVKTLCLHDLAITRGLNVFANSVKDQFAHLVAQFAVLASSFGDQKKIALGFEQKPHESNVAVEYLHACICQNQRVKSILSSCFKVFLIDETPNFLCCLYHVNCEILIGHGTQSFHFDEQVGGQKFCCKCQV